MAAEFPPWPYLERPVYSREGPVPYEPWPVEEWPVEPWPGAGGAGTTAGLRPVRGGVPALAPGPGLLGWRMRTAAVHGLAPLAAGCGGRRQRGSGSPA